MSEDGIAEIMREMERNALRLQNGIKLAMGMEFARVGPTPKQTVWSSGKTELWRYDTEPGAVKHAPPILLVPSVVSRSYVFDLHRGNSFVERLLEAGFAVYLIDWGIAGKEESTNTFETYVDELMPQAVAAACEDAGTDELTMLGYCFSGLLTMLYLAGHPDAPIRSLVSLRRRSTTPPRPASRRCSRRAASSPRTSSTRTATSPATSCARRSPCASRRRTWSRTPRSGTTSGRTTTSRATRRWRSSSASRSRCPARCCARSSTS